MKPETLEELKALASRYAKYGVTVDELIPIVNNRPDEVSERAAVIGVRMVLGETYGEHDYFTIDDICEVTGETPNEVSARMKKMHIEGARTPRTPMQGLPS